MLNILDVVSAESQETFDYLDEKVMSTVYLSSLPTSQKALLGFPEGKEKDRKVEANNWLLNETGHICDIPVLNFDKIKEKLNNGKCSCDALFYNFDSSTDQLHYLAEFKNINKNVLLKMLDSEDVDSIYNKVRDSVEIILKEIILGGQDEHEILVSHMHFFIVYGGKNNVASRKPVIMPNKMKVERNAKNKQSKASRMKMGFDKEEQEVYKRFGKKIYDLKLAPCTKDIFPGTSLPCFSRMGKGKEKMRSFSIFSAHDFGEIIDAGFFDSWEWGNYSTYFESSNML